MNPEKQRIVIAEACGWSGFEYLHSEYEPPAGVPPQNEITEKLLGPQKITNWTPRFNLPDYLNDLNAMHEAEKTLTQHPEWDSNGERCPSKQEKYDWYLHRICNGSPTFATAQQRAEAFLKTIGKWEE